MGENRKAVNAILRKNAERIERAKAQSLKCPRCVTRIEGWWRFCAECGLHLDAGPSMKDPPFGCPPDEPNKQGDK